MKESKTFFIVPGFTMQAKDRAFKWLVEFLDNKGIKFVLVPVHWKNRTLTQNATEFVNFYNKHKRKENYILGFSYGAVITFLTANILKPKKIYLCSLSPDFMEDRNSFTPKIIRYIGKRRSDDTKTRSAIKIAKELQVPSILFYGEKEAKKYPQLKKRVEDTVRFAKNSKLVFVKDAPHQIDFPEYTKEIKKELSKI